MKKLLARIVEPSTWAGVAGVLAAAMPVLPPPLSLYANIGAALASGLAVAMKEKGTPAEPTAEAVK